MKYRLLLLITIFILTACSVGRKQASSDDNFDKYKSLIEKEFTVEIQKLSRRYSSIKISKRDVSFHNDTSDYGFFRIEFNTSKLLQGKEFYMVEINGSNYNDAYVSSGFSGKRIKTKVVYGRFFKPGPVKIKLFIKNFSDGNYPLFQVHEFSFNTPSKVSKNKTIVKKWIKECEYRNGYNGKYKSLFHDYLKMALPYKYYGRAGSYGYRSYRRLRNREKLSVIDILSGKTAIKETLQSSYKKLSRGNKIKDIPLNSLTGITVSELPFHKMLKEKPEIFKTADFVPFDNFYINIRSLSKAIEFMDLAKSKNILPVSLNGDYKNYHISEKISKQMGLEVSSLEKYFGNNLISNIAITSDDLFFGNGTGISIIYETKNSETFISSMEEKFNGYVKKDGAVKRENLFGAYRIQSVVTKDNSVSIYMVSVKNYCIVSNRLEAIKRVLNTYDEKIPAMSRNYDFLYMRNVYKVSATDEDAFTFLADPFIRKTLSPAWIIGKMRRISVAEDLKLISSSILFRKREGKLTIPSIKELLKDKYLVKGAIINSIDDYMIDPVTSVPYSRTLGRIGYLKPISELSIKFISDSERKIYKEFKSYYNKFWDKFFDPIGISIKIADRVEVKTTILPLINNSIYKSISKFVGGNPVSLKLKSTDDTIISLGLKINSSELTDEIERKLKRYDFSGSKDRSGGIFGDNVVINFHDHDLLFLIDHQKLLRNTRVFTRGKSQAYLSLLAAFFNLPVSISIDLKNHEKFKNSGFSHRLMYALNDTSFFRDNEVKIYGITPYKGQTIMAADIGFYYIKFPIYFALVDDILVIATKYHIIKDMFKKRFENIQKGKKDYQVKANAFIHFNPMGYKKILPQLKQFFLTKALDASQAAKKHYSAFIYPGRDYTIPFAEESMKFYGFDYGSLLGENFFYDPLYPSGIKSNVTLEHSIPHKLNSSALKIFNSQTFNTSTVTFSFTKHGIQTKVVFDR
jgi:hypothetical protein